MRLTERVIDKKGIEHIMTKYVPNNQKLKDEKLCQLEDIEDDLGIDLVTLFKAQTNGFYVKTALGIFTVILSDWKFNLIKRRIQRTQFSNHYYFKDYGKTWALTKEELEK